MANGEEQRRAAALLKLADAEFFAFGDRQVVQLQKQIGAIARGPGLPPPGAPVVVPPLLAVGAPATVDVDRHAELPALVAIVQTGLRRWQVSYELNLSVVAVDLRTGALRCFRPFADFVREPDVEPSAAGEPPGFQAANSTTTSVRRIDLRRFLAVESREADLALTLLAHDRRSNTVVVHLSGARAPEVQVPPQRPSRFVRSVLGDRPLPALEGPGATLSVPERAAAGEPVPVHVSLALPAARAPIAEPLDPGGPRVVRATLLFTALDHGARAAIELLAPAAFTAPGGQEQMVLAAFELDAREALAGHLHAGVYQVHLFAGDQAAGPCALTVEERATR